MKQVYLLTGPNEVSKREFINELCKDVDSDNISTYYAVEADPGMVFGECAQSSLFGERSIVIIRKIGDLTKKTEFQDKLLNYLDSPNPDTTLILNWDKPSSKVMTKINGYKDYEKKNFKKFYESDLLHFARNKFMEASIKFEESILDYLLILTNYEIEDLSMNIRMLIDYAGESRDLTLEQAKQILSSSHNLSVFDLMDGIFMKKKEKALRALQDFRLSSNNHILQLLALMLSETSLVWSYLTLKNKTSNIGQEIGVSGFRLKKIMEKARHVNLKFLSSLFELIESLEIKSKSMNEDFAYLELESFITQLH